MFIQKQTNTPPTNIEIKIKIYNKNVWNSIISIQDGLRAVGKLIPKTKPKHPPKTK